MQYGEIMNKNKNDVIGYKIQCPEFNQCPICYGCRAYDPSNERCVKLCNSSKHRCNTARHKADLLSKMLSKNTVNIT